MAASSPATDSRKRPSTSPHGSSAGSLCLDFSDCANPSCNKRRPSVDIICCKVSGCSCSSSCLQPLHISFFSDISFPKEDAGSSFSRSPKSLAPVTSSSTSALVVEADSAIESALVSSVQHECSSSEQGLLCCVSSDEEAGSCCGGNDTSELDVTGFLLCEVWDEEGSEGGDASAFDPETIDVFKYGGASSASCSEDDSFTGCSADNGNWFLNDLECEGYAHLNEVLDQEWMAAAAANLDRINDTLDSDLCVLHLFESDYASEP